MAGWSALSVTPPATASVPFNPAGCELEMASARPSGRPPVSSNTSSIKLNARAGTSRPRRTTTAITARIERFMDAPSFLSVRAAALGHREDVADLVRSGVPNCQGRGRRRHAAGDPVGNLMAADVDRLDAGRERCAHLPPEDHVSIERNGQADGFDGAVLIHYEGPAETPPVHVRLHDELEVEPFRVSDYDRGHERRQPRRLTPHQLHRTYDAAGDRKSTRLN